MKGKVLVFSAKSKIQFFAKWALGPFLIFFKKIIFSKTPK